MQNIGVVMQSCPLITVVIPAYNRQDTIARCIDSVLAQTYKKLEVIVVDDSSTDNTVSIVRSHPDSRVRCVVLDKKAGAQGARNRGILEAKADWIAFQDSDDEWLPEKLEKQVSVLSQSNFDPWKLVYCNAYRFDKERSIKTIRLLPVIEGVDQYKKLLQHPSPLYPTIITSKMALEKIGYLDEQVPSFQEWDTSIRLAKYCKITHLKEPLMIYHVGKGDEISGNPINHVEGWNYIISKYEGDIKEYCGEKAWQMLNLQLLGKCLDLGLMDYYDRYQSEKGVMHKYHMQMLYLRICRKCRFKPSMIINRFTRGLLRILGYYEASQGGLIKEA